MSKKSVIFFGAEEQPPDCDSVGHARLRHEFERLRKQFFRETRRNEPRRNEPRRDEPRRDDRPRDEPRRDEPRRDDRPRDDRQRRGRRDDDLGPSVRGFGDDVPAFMLIPARAPRHAVHAEAAEELETP